MREGSFLQEKKYPFRTDLTTQIWYVKSSSKRPLIVGGVSLYEWFPVLLAAIRAMEYIEQAMGLFRAS